MSDLSATNCGGGCSCNENNSSWTHLLESPAAPLCPVFFPSDPPAWAVIAAASFGFSLSSAAAEAITDSVDSAAAAN